MKSITGEITDSLVEGGAVAEDERNMYLYCVEGLIEMTANILLTLIFGLVIGKFIETLIFLLIIIPLRSMGGGFHAESGKVCFIFSLSVYLITIFSAGALSETLNYRHSLWLYIVCAAFILLTAPVDSKNKRISAEEKKKFKRICFFIMLPISLIFIAVWIFNLWGICYLISCCLAAVSILLLLGIAKNITVRRRSRNHSKR